MAECHPVGFQWVMEAKARGAKVIHVDPRFTRTSAVSDMHVPLRAGSDIVFLGGIINYVLGCAGLEPACAKACPTQSIQFGPLDELRERAQLRVEDLRAGRPGPGAAVPG